MRILQVTDTLQPGGAERVAVDLANFLASEGHVVFFCATRKRGALESAIIPGVSVTCLDRTSTFSGLVRLRKYVIDNEIEFVHAHGNSSAQFCIVSLFGISSVRIIHHDHNPVLTKRNSMIERLVLARADQWIVVSRPILEWVVQKVKYSNPKLILNPINTHRFKACISGLTQPVTIVALANYRTEKHYENLIKIARIARSKGLRIQLNCYGSHYQSEYFRHIKALCDTDELGEIVKLNPPSMEVPDILANANMGILFSLHEGLPIGLLEYMASSLPVVVTNVGDCGEIVKKSGCGEVVASNDPDAFVKAIEMVVNSTNRLRMGGNGKNYVDQHHSIEAFGARIINEVYSAI